jgi:hypothetical protein
LRDQFPKEQVVAILKGDDQKFTVYYYTARDPASSDFAKQLLVMIGTLVTSVASFYFGSRTASSQAPASGSPTPALRAVTPSTLVRSANPTKLQVTGENLNSIKEVKIALGTRQILATSVLSSASSIECQIIVDPNATSGSWDLIVTNGQTSTLPGAISVQ